MEIIFYETEQRLQFVICPSSTNTHSGDIMLQSVTGTSCYSLNELVVFVVHLSSTMEILGSGINLTKARTSIGLVDDVLSPRSDSHVLIQKVNRQLLVSELLVGSCQCRTGITLSLCVSNLTCYRKLYRHRQIREGKSLGRLIEGVVACAKLKLRVSLCLRVVSLNCAI